MSDEQSTPATPTQQSTCCRHASRLACVTASDRCPQGFGAHSLPDEEGYEQTCECGQIMLTTEVWKNCSGRKHVYINGSTRCACLKKHGGIHG